MKKQSLLQLLVVLPLLLITFLGNTQTKKSQLLNNGSWLGTIIRADSNTIQFNFISSLKKGKQVIYIINGDEKAELALRSAGKYHFIALAKTILGKIHDDGDRATTPWGVMKNLFDFKKKFD